MSEGLEAISTLSATALRSDIGDNKAPCAGDSGSIPKRGNAGSADVRPQPAGPGLFSRISALLVACLATAKQHFSRLELRENSALRGRRSC
jgi:hypothetical protein